MNYTDFDSDADYGYDHEQHVDRIVANEWNAVKDVRWSEDGRDVYVGRTRMFNITGQSEEGYIDEFHDAFAMQLYDEWGAFDECEEDFIDEHSYLCSGNLH